MTMFDELKELKTMLDQNLISRDEHTMLHAEILRRAMSPPPSQPPHSPPPCNPPMPIPAPGETIFRHPHTGVISRVTAQGSFWLTLGLGSFYFAYKEHWLAAVGGILAALLTYGLSWLVFPFFAHRLIIDNYRRKGWIEIGEGLDQKMSERTNATFGELKELKNMLSSAVRLPK
jgi:hypothetical protein